jgi:hypothetical protein
MGLGIMYYGLGVLIAAAAMPWMFDEDPLDLWPRIGAGAVSVACIAAGSLLRTTSLARRTLQMWVLGLGVCATTLAAFFTAPEVTLALAVLCVVGVAAVSHRSGETTESPRHDG